MISKLSEKAAEKLLVQDNLSQEDRELYVYGFFMFFSQAFYFLQAIIWGVFFRIPLESAMFYIMFSIIRGYAGGVHASRESVCMICTSLSLLICVAAMKVCLEHSLIVAPSIILTVSTICILILSPLDSEEKQVLASEKKEYRKKSYLFTALIVSAAILAFICGFSIFFYPCTASLFLESLLLILGKVKESERLK